MEEKGLSEGTAVRHFNVMHRMMGKAATIWSKATGINRNPADEVEVKRPNDQRERYLSVEELPRLKQTVDEKMYRSNRSHYAHADRRDLRLEMGRLVVWRGYHCRASQVEARQDPIRAHAAGVSS
jgi:hypothetical protein